MDYNQDLKRDDFASDDDYWLERVKRGVAAGFTFRQWKDHQLIDLGLALGLTPTEILAIVGPYTGYVFPNACPQRSP